jgi:hypothetical protein
MTEQKRKSWIGVPAVIAAAIVAVGLGVWTSDPVQRALAPADMVQEDGAASEAAAAEDAAADEGAADDKAAAEAETAAAEDLAAAEEERRIAAADEAAAETEKDPPKGGTQAAAVTCCKPGDTTPPLELIKQVPPGELHNPYDWQALKAEHADDPDYLVKQFRLPGCNECHGGGGGGGFCPALSQGVWFWGNTDDVLFRLIALGSAELEKQGFERIQWGTVHAPMPMMGHVIKTSDHLWKIVAFLRSINPPGSNPPEKVIPGRYTPPKGE